MRRQTIHSRLYQTTLAVYRAILALTPRQRRAALRELDKLTHTNCGWHLYAMREPLREFIRVAAPRRARKEKS